VRVTVAGVALAISVVAVLFSGGQFLVEYRSLASHSEVRLHVDIQSGGSNYADIPLKYTIFPGTYAFCPLRLVLVNESERAVVVTSTDVRDQTGAECKIPTYWRTAEYTGARLELPITIQPWAVAKAVVWFEFLLPPEVADVLLDVYPDLRDGSRRTGYALQIDMMLAGGKLDLIGNARPRSDVVRTTDKRVSAVAWIGTSEGRQFSTDIEWIPFRYLNGQAINPQKEEFSDHPAEEADSERQILGSAEPCP